MYILLALLGETATIAGSTAIAVNGAKNMMFELAKHGYKVNYKAVEEYQKNHKDEKEQSKGKKILSRISFFTPGVNMAIMGYQVHKLKKEVVKDPEFQKLLTPMTEEEKEQFASIKSKFEKLAYLMTISEIKNEDEQVIDVSDNKVLVSDSDLLSLKRADRITSYTYTYDEVKKLNEVTGQTYRIGLVNDLSTAIIGIANPDFELKRVAFDDEEKQDFVSIPEETRDERRYFVYSNDISTREAVLKAADELREKRYAHVPMLHTEPTATKTVEEAPKLVLKVDEQKN